MLNRLALFITLGICQLSLATPPVPIPPAPIPTPSTYPDVVEIQPPIISLRSLNTGEPVSNRNYDRNDPKEVQWRLVDTIVKNRRFVQFKVIGKETRCLVGADGGNLPCTQQETLFNLIPTDTGAFILTEPDTGRCFTSENYGSYGLQVCFSHQEEPQHIPLKHLWIIAPPFGQTQLLSR